MPLTSITPNVSEARSLKSTSVSLSLYASSAIFPNSSIEPESADSDIPSSNTDSIGAEVQSKILPPVVPVTDIQ
tara:strand:- start:367 stop:588 length:222 start_codon:yes stop_codon:yes gene_type:complete